jgi:ligand-binding sensor domain-containing protein
MKIKALITLLFILPIGVFSQNSSFITYGIEEGLIQSHVQSLVQDNYGNLWIGTIGGLSKYDGTGFKNFTQKDSLAEDWITVSFKSKNGNIWHGHWGGGVTVYNTEKNLFTDLKVEQYSNYKYITSITEDAFGNIWFGTENAGLFYYSQSSGTAAKLNADLSSNLVYSLLTDNSGKIWAGTSSGINIITPVEQGGGKVSGKITLINGQSFSAKSLLAAFDNEVWAGTENFGIVRVNTNSIANNNAENAEITFITTESGLTSNNIKTLYRDNKNNIWIGTKDKGVIQFIPITTDNKSFARGEINVFSNKFELKYYHANIFLQDREGNIWMGTEIGLSKYRGELFRIYNHNDNLVNNLVWAVIQDKSGDIWMGTSDGITRFSFPVIGTKKQYNNPVAQSFTKANGLPENIIISLYEDASGNIWAGTENFGLFVMSKEGKILKKYDVSSGFPDNKIFTIAGDKNGNTWVGTRAGATVIDNTGNIVKTYTTNDGLGANKVYKIYRFERNNMVWCSWRIFNQLRWK